MIAGSTRAKHPLASFPVKPVTPTQASSYVTNYCSSLIPAPTKGYSSSFPSCSSSTKIARLELHGSNIPGHEARPEYYSEFIPFFPRLLTPDPKLRLRLGGFFILIC